MPSKKWVPLSSLQGTAFSKTKVDFGGAKLCPLESQKCTTEGIKFPEGDYAKASNFKDADFGYADVFEAEFRAVDLSQARLDRARNLQTAFLVDDEAIEKQGTHNKLRTRFMTVTWLSA